jgi:nucleoside-diphosphate-sugar epimerase
MKILVTGASGFIGSFIVEEALKRGMETWAVVRGTSSRQYLQDERIHFVELDFDDQSQMEKKLSGLAFDYVVHAAGVTKCLDSEDFYRINTKGTKNFIRALIKLKMPLKKFVYLSSLSVYGDIHTHQPYKPIRENDTPRPNTDYGQSKLDAEQWITNSLECREAQLPYVFLRPTGVYGPRERDYFLMAKSIKQHVDFAVGFKQQDITFVYVLDVVQAVFLACEKGQAGRKYFLSDGQVYQSSTFSDLIRRELGNPWWIRITAPIWLLRVITAIGDKWGHITGKISALNNDKYHILKQRNWRCDIQPAIDELGYHPEYTLERGVPLTISWYKENGWL